VSARLAASWSGGTRADCADVERPCMRSRVPPHRRAVSREELLTRLWGIGPQRVETRTIDMHIARLRTKLRDPSGRATPEAILTVRAHGYMAAPDLHPLEAKAAES